MSATTVEVSFEKNRLKACFPFSPKESAEILQAMRQELHKLVPDFKTFIKCHFVTNAQMEDMNKSFTGAPGPTNTLAFEAGKADGFLLPAQIFFSVPQYGLEHLIYGQEPKSYAICLMAHAMSHLAGFEHGAEMDAVSQKLESRGLKEMKRLAC